MARWSPCLAARISGVAPSPSVPSPGVWLRISVARLSLASTSAPRAISSSIRSSAECVSVHRPVRTAVNLAERAHVHRGIQRRHARAVGDVRIRAFLEQHGGGVVMGVDDRANERGRPFRIRSVQTRRPPRASARAASGAPSRAAYINAVQSPFGSDGQHSLEAERIPRELQRARLRVDVGAARQQQRDDGGVILGRRPHQRLLTQDFLARVNLRALVQQRLDRCRVAGASGRHQAASGRE